MTPRNTTVQRITQVVHPVGRGKKKQLLAHIIQEHNWSQVLVFTRTKFGANNVAEFLTKNGIQAMALHGNKSQSARTQALAGFKSGDIRALVATDIAARGIDIDELPHVVNYEIPNVPEDYVHRIGRTGRAGNEGAAVSFVCLDEEGFMQEIERFTKQRIPAAGGRGLRPRARRARRTHRHGPPDHLGRRRQAAEPRSDDGRRQGRAPGNDAAHPRQQGRRRARGGQRRPSPGSRKASAAPTARPAATARQRQRQWQRHAPQRQRQPQARAAPARRSRAGRPHGHSPRHGDDAQPRDGAHNSASPFVQRDATRETYRWTTRPACAPASTAWAGADAAAAGGGGGRSNRGGGGGFGPRGPGNPARTFGR